MTIEGVHAGFAFTGNPVTVISSDATAGTRAKIVVSVDEEEIYEGRATFPLKIDVAEVLDACLPQMTGAPERSADMLEVLFHPDTAAVEVTAADGSFSARQSFLIIKGGVSAANLRTYARGHTDAFAARFLNLGANFMLTTRTSGPVIVIPETEVAPLYFVSGTPFTLSVKSPVSGRILHVADIEAPRICALMVDNIRLQFIGQYDEVPSVLDIYTGGQSPACRIVVAEAPVAAERYLLRFRNSLGVYDMLALDAAGTLSEDTDAGTDSDSDYGRYDVLTGEFSTSRDRSPHYPVLELAGVAVSAARRTLVADLLHSDEVWLLAGDNPVRVLPSCDDFSGRVRPVGPEKITLTLRGADPATSVMPMLPDADASEWYRIFSDEFSDIFS